MPVASEIILHLSKHQLAWVELGTVGRKEVHLDIGNSQDLVEHVCNAVGVVYAAIVDDEHVAGSQHAVGNEFAKSSAVLEAERGVETKTGLPTREVTCKHKARIHPPKSGTASAPPPLQPTHTVKVRTSVTL